MRKVLCPVIAALAAAVLFSCASAGSRDAGKGGADFVSVSLLHTREIRAEFGASGSENPFLFPTAFIVPEPNDYLVLKLAARAAAPAALEVLQAEATDSSGKVRASFYDRKAFRDKTAEELSPLAMNRGTRLNKIDWYYLPSLSFTLPAGAREYVLVLVGHHPFPEDLSVVVRVTLNGVEQDFTLGVPGEPR